MGLGDSKGVGKGLKREKWGLGGLKMWEKWDLG